MHKSAPDFMTLNAYVDGELDAEHAAEVAHAVAHDRELAEQVAAISQLRLAVSEGVEAPALSLPPESRIFRAPVKPMFLAACVAGLLMFTSAVIMQTHDSGFREGWIPRAWAVHDSWNPPTSYPTADNGNVAVVPATASGELASGYVPDLTSAKLFVAHVELLKIQADKEALLIGYTGTRGCKVSLLISQQSPPLENAITFIQQGDITLYGWRAGKLDYIVMSNGMDAARFQTVANAIYDATRAHLPLDNQTRVALQESRANSAPCLA